MEQQPLLSIAIPTYNRAVFLRKLLENILPQVSALQGLAQISISNNGSTDSTHQVVADFQARYPGLITYHENEKNLGFDKNVLRVLEMAQGDFIWLLGDDDLVVDGGVKKVVDFACGQADKNMGVGMFSHVSYSLDAKTGKEMVYLDTTKKDKPKIYAVSLKDIIGVNFSNSFLSVLLFNNHFVKKILHEEARLIEQATGNYYIHTFVYQLMLLKYPQLEMKRYNEVIIKADAGRHPEFHISGDKVLQVFNVFYAGRKKLNDLLLHSNYSGDYKQALIGQQKKLKRSMVKEMGLIKVFSSKNASFFICLPLFFRQSAWLDALYLSFFFSIFYIAPSFILRKLYRFFIRIKHGKNWQKIWLDIALKHA